MVPITPGPLLASCLPPSTIHIQSLGQFSPKGPSVSRGSTLDPMPQVPLCAGHSLRSSQSCFHGQTSLSQSHLHVCDTPKHLCLLSRGISLLRHRLGVPCLNLSWPSASGRAMWPSALPPLGAAGGSFPVESCPVLLRLSAGETHHCRSLNTWLRVAEL